MPRKHHTAGRGLVEAYRGINCGIVVPGFEFLTQWAEVKRFPIELDHPVQIMYDDSRVAKTQNHAASALVASVGA